MIRFFTGLGAIMVFSLVGWVLNLLFNYIGKKIEPIKEYKWYIKLSNINKKICIWLDIILGIVAIILVFIFIFLVISGIGQIIIG